MTLYFSDAQGQLTPWLDIGSDRNSNSLMLFCMFWLPTRLKENQMENECARVVKTLYSYILDAQGHLTM